MVEKEDEITGGYFDFRFWIWDIGYRICDRNSVGLTERPRGLGEFKIKAVKGREIWR